jgi:hypothetical protein
MPFFPFPLFLPPPPHIPNLKVNQVNGKVDSSVGTCHPFPLHPLPTSSSPSSKLESVGQSKGRQSDSQADGNLPIPPLLFFQNISIKIFALAVGTQPKLALNQNYAPLRNLLVNFISELGFHSFTNCNWILKNWN